MLSVQGLSKRFGDRLAVDDLGIEVEPGTIFGLLGPNGAGKSTTINCIAGLLRPDAGRIEIGGHDLAKQPVKARQALGFVPQELALYDDLTVRQNLRFWGEAYGLRGRRLRHRVDTVLARIGLSERGNDRVKRLSGGMKRRLNLGCGLVHQPRVLLLDEPTVAVDPRSRYQLIGLIRDEVQRGTSVVYTTHHMDEAESLCDRLAIVDQGRAIASGTLEALRRQLGERDVLELAGRFEPATTARLEQLREVEVVSLAPDRLVLSVSEASKRLSALFETVSDAGGVVYETTLRRPSLETLFLKLTGRELSADTTIETPDNAGARRSVGQSLVAALGLSRG